jgi:CubicO group peptidase (beta-lactamase class C family)
MNISSVTRFACVAKIAIPSRIATKRFTAKISGRCFALPITHSGYSTVDDLLRFAQALRSGKLISRPLLREATTAQTHYGYSLGFVLFGEGGFGHTGGMPGANGELLILPRSRYLLIVLVNRDPRMASDIAELIRQSLPQPSM